MGAHPHSRGENSRYANDGLRQRGSSPLTRGKRLDELQEAAGRRLIPTHAGKTKAPPPESITTAAHPHSRGENLSALVDAYCPAGSSPLTRGKRLLERLHRVRSGLIPTHAGKTGKTDVALEELGAHPHSRGENMAMRRVGIGPSGSSPLTRGKHLLAQYDRMTGGLIPTHAGKTVVRSLGSGFVRAHPHSRGENPHGSKRSIRPMGSSPLTRGKHQAPVLRASARGLIPTHAGKTAAHALAEIVARAHPHSRGENTY